KVVNPEKGFIATANSRVVNDVYPYHLSNNWAQPYRYERIFEVLDEADELTVDDMKALQMDAVNLRAREFVPYFSGLLNKNTLSEFAQTALSLLNEWDFTDDANLPQPLIFDQWMATIETVLFDELS